MKYEKALLDEIYTPKGGEVFVEASNVPLEWFSPFDKSRFNIINTEFKDDNHFLRFSPQELKKIENVSNDVCFLAKFSAGIQMMFVTDARIIKLKCENITDFPMCNMPFVSRAGFDCYTKEKDEDEFQFHYSTFAPNYEKGSSTKWEDFILAFHENKKRIVLINFPLYNGVKELQIGIEQGRSVEPYYYGNKKRILCYGTSILEGCSASRPGQATTNYLSMKLRQEVLNYGFSGSALCEKEVAEILATRKDIEMFIIDAEANAGWSHALADNFPDFVKIINDAHPDTPIIVMNRVRCNQDDENYSFINRMKEFNDKVLLDVVNEYKNKGKKIYFVDNFALFKDSSFTIDGLHPTSDGFEKINESYLTAIRKVKEENYL